MDFEGYSLLAVFVRIRFSTKRSFDIDRASFSQKLITNFGLSSPNHNIVPVRFFALSWLFTFFDLLAIRHKARSRQREVRNRFARFCFTTDWIISQSANEDNLV